VDRFQYLLVLGASVVGTLPLEILFDARVWRRPRRLALALAPALAVFGVWDLWASARGTWGFSDRYTLGVELPGGMVVEEIGFFVVVPVCALLTFEAVRNLRTGRVRWPVTLVRAGRTGRADRDHGPGRG
jgi:lycopene cyclase domain-containing protein